MILKIKRFWDNQTWWILDDIRKVSISTTLEFSREEYKENLFQAVEMYILDKFTNSVQESGGRFPYVRLSCKLSNGNEFSVVFDTVAYLCNDSGKTIEKLTV